MQLENLALNWKILATGTKRLPGAQVSSWQGSALCLGSSRRAGWEQKAHLFPALLLIHVLVPALQPAQVLGLKGEIWGSSVLRA